MKITKSGFIIKTSKFGECIHFYKAVLQLEVLFENSNLTCFGLSGSYLMVEPHPPVTGEGRNEQLILRLNVDDVVAARDHLKAQGIEAFYEKFEWGEIATFYDPAGTKIELKDSIKFEDQILKNRDQRTNS